MNDVVIVGAGLAGLAASAFCARAGLQVTVVERSQNPGGRARTDRVAGHAFNQGGHALYAKGAAARVLAEHGGSFRGRPPPASGLLAVTRRGMHKLPSSVLSIMSTDLLGLGAKVEAARALVTIAASGPSPSAPAVFGARLARRDRRPAGGAPGARRVCSPDDLRERPRPRERGRDDRADSASRRRRPLRRRRMADARGRADRRRSIEARAAILRSASVAAVARDQGSFLVSLSDGKALGGALRHRVRGSSPRRVPSSASPPRSEGVPRRPTPRAWRRRASPISRGPTACSRSASTSPRTSRCTRRRPRSASEGLRFTS